MPLTRDGGYMALESDEGGTLYFTKYGTHGLWSIPTTGGPEKLVLEALSLYNWGNWTVGADGIYFLEHTAEGRLISRFDPATETVTRLQKLEPISLSYEAGLTVSLDGQWLLQARTDRAESDLVLVEAFQ